VGRGDIKEAKVGIKGFTDRGFVILLKDQKIEAAAPDLGPEVTPVEVDPQEESAEIPAVEATPDPQEGVVRWHRKGAR
jgi:hypothetical protein